MSFSLNARLAPSVLAALALLANAVSALGSQPWQVLKDCRLVSSASADADSFHVRAGGKEYIFRLYFVDAPEAETSFPERVAEQAKYFGITSEQALQLGKHAKKFTREKLARPFTVRTYMQDARGRSKLDRHYAFVEASDGDLAELLVANGLGRVYGSAATPAGLSSPERQWRKLERLEREAKAAKVGGWGAASGRMMTRLPKQPAKTGPDSFEAFFHPERVAAAAPDASAASETATAPSRLSGAGKLDVNSATSAELLEIPGLGPVIARRVIEARPFKSADDLRTVKGIGPRTYQSVRPYFR